MCEQRGQQVASVIHVAADGMTSCEPNVCSKENIFDLAPRVTAMLFKNSTPATSCFILLYFRFIPSGFHQSPTSDSLAFADQTLYRLGGSIPSSSPPAAETIHPFVVLPPSPSPPHVSVCFLSTSAGGSCLQLPSSFSSYHCLTYLSLYLLPSPRNADTNQPVF